MGLGKTLLENIVGKGEIACTMFSTLSKTVIIIFVTFVVCKCFQSGLVQNFVMWEWVNIMHGQDALIMFPLTRAWPKYIQQ